MRSQRSRSRGVVGRKSRSNSRVRSTVPTIESTSIVCRPSARSPARPSASTTSSNGRITATSSGSPRRRAESSASARRRRARAKSDWASARGEPVSGGMALNATGRRTRAKHPAVRRRGGRGCRGGGSSRSRWCAVAPSFCGRRRTAALTAVCEGRSGRRMGQGLRGWRIWCAGRPKTPTPGAAGAGGRGSGLLRPWPGGVSNMSRSARGIRHTPVRGRFRTRRLAPFCS